MHRRGPLQDSNLTMHTTLYYDSGCYAFFWGWELTQFHKWDMITLMKFPSFLQRQGRSKLGFIGYNGEYKIDVFYTKGSIQNTPAQAE